MSTRLILILNFFCDRQNLNENQKNGNACPWYSSGDSRHSKLTLNFSIKVKLELQDINIQVNDFTSHKFSQYFLKTPFQSTSSYNEWDHTEKFITLVQKVNSILDYVNKNGYWKVIGWSKRGEINDQSAIGEEQKVSSTEVKHHITSIFPTFFLDADIMSNIEELKYDNSA